MFLLCRNYYEGTVRENKQLYTLSYFNTTASQSVLLLGINQISSHYHSSEEYGANSFHVHFLSEIFTLINP